MTPFSRSQEALAKLTETSAEIGWQLLGIDEKSKQEKG
jgi:hypothetical protein